MRVPSDSGYECELPARSGMHIVKCLLHVGSFGTIPFVTFQIANQTRFPLSGEADNRGAPPAQQIHRQRIDA